MNTPWNDDRPAANGRAVRENFAHWFGASKVVTEQGEPRVVFHGTNYDFAVFKNQWANKPWEMFSSSAAYANVFAGPYGGQLIPAYLSLQNPIDLSRAQGLGARAKLIELLDEHGVKFKASDIPKEYGLHHVVHMAGHHSNLPRALMNAGFDGIVMPDKLEGMAPRGSVDVDLHATTFIAFDPTQIKSAIGNSGLYLKSNPSFADEQAGVALLQARQAKAILGQVTKTSGAKVMSC